jgi:hypothetical protein
VEEGVHWKRNGEGYGKLRIYLYSRLPGAY